MKLFRRVDFLIEKLARNINEKDKGRCSVKWEFVLNVGGLWAATMTMVVGAVCVIIVRGAVGS